MEFIIVLVALAIAYAVYKAYFAKSADEVAELAPYKVEVESLVIDDTPVVAEVPVKVKKAPAKKAPAAKKPAVKAKTARKPKAK